MRTPRSSNGHRIGQRLELAVRPCRSDGVFTMYNYYRQQWLVDRLAGTLDQVYGHPPCIDTTGLVGHFAVLTTSVDPQRVSCTTVWRPGELGVPSPATDDYPFVYLRTRSIPRSIS